MRPPRSITSSGAILCSNSTCCPFKILPLIELTQRSSLTRSLPLTNRQLVNLVTPEPSCAKSGLPLLVINDGILYTVRLAEARTVEYRAVRVQGKGIRTGQRPERVRCAVETGLSTNLKRMARILWY